MDISVHYENNNSVEILSKSLRQILTDKTVLLCVGTDRCIGDVLGPLIGTMLQKKNFRFPVYGTLDNPIHAINIEKFIHSVYKLYPAGLFVAIDACLGHEESIGIIRIKKGPIFPGKAVGKRLPPIGNIAITGVIDKFDYDNHLAIHTIRFNIVYKMAEIISDALILASYLS